MAEDTHEMRLEEYDAEVRAKYTADDLKELQDAGKAMPPSKDGDDPSYPISDQDDLAKAIKAVGRGNADHDAIRLHIIAQAHKLGLTKLIPDNWNMTSGSVKQENATKPPLARRAKKPRHRSGPSIGIEVRHFAAEGLEIRSAEDGSDAIRVTGSPIVYNAPYAVRDMFGEFQETMAPGVATSVLPTADCRFLFNHQGLPLARTLSGTMTLSDTDSALTFTADLDPRQQLANDLAVAIERGDVSQMSCGFIVADDAWSPDETERTIYRFSNLLDVSAVTYPASPTTDIAVAQRMMLDVPVESRARVRRMWAVSRDLRDGKEISREEVDLLAAGLHALADVSEDRAAPTDADKGITTKIKVAHQAVVDAIHAQTNDPDNASDPVDAEVMGHLHDMAKAGMKALTAQGVDMAPDNPAERDAEPIVPPGEVGGQQGDQMSPSPDPAAAKDGTGSRSTDLLRLEMELRNIQRRRKAS